MHIDTGATPSETEAMYFPPPRRLNSDAGTSRQDVLDAAYDFKMPSAVKETPTSSRQDIWAELRYDTVPS
jgi:hypothetical protein